ncbi:MAG TPA: hypothetical protein V6C84_04295 [Coleofasciculaceae cyanobacterium]|jgi:nanoRNase/pAp phosphatase (c-di-AMP/oligoRNAs hydrolase)
MVQVPHLYSASPLLIENPPKMMDATAILDHATRVYLEKQQDLARLRAIAAIVLDHPEWHQQESRLLELLREDR